VTALDAILNLSKAEETEEVVAAAVVVAAVLGLPLKSQWTPVLLSAESAPTTLEQAPVDLPTTTA
jgi:hypothetical protein